MTIQFKDAAGVFPARAGMSPRHVLVRVTRQGVPRASGDEPYSDIAWLTAEACSPRERG